MEEVLYIVLGIIWLVVSVINSNKKKKKEAERRKTASESSPQPIPYEEEQSPAPSSSTSQAPVNTLDQESEEVDFEDILEDFFGSDKPKKPSKSKEYRSEQRDDIEEKRYEASRESYRADDSVKEDIPDSVIEKFEGAVEKGYEFSAEGKVETIEDLIKSYDQRSSMAQEEDEKLQVVELDGEETPYASNEDSDFDVRKAIIYSTIINKKY